MDRKEGLEDIARRVREVLADDPDAGDELRRTRSAVLGKVERRKMTSRFLRWSPGVPRRRSLLLAISASVAAGAAALWIWTRPPTFAIGEARPGELGDVVEASDGRVVPVSFSDGSTLVLRDGGRIRVLIAGRGRRPGAGGGRRRGRHHRSSPGPQDEMGVRGGPVPRDGDRHEVPDRVPCRRWVAAGVDRSGPGRGRGRVPGSARHGRRGRESGAVLRAPRRSRGRRDGAWCRRRRRTPRRRSANQPNQIERWRQLLAAGRLLDGLRAAERASFDQVCRVATEKELLALADAGRFFGPSKRAVAALTALRQRFPGSPDAGTAAFTLGRIAFESDHDYGKAADWFETYMQEQPRGPLMGDAFGRLMEARLHSGDGAGARASAQQYLRRFPGGPYSSEARGILSK